MLFRSEGWLLFSSSLIDLNEDRMSPSIKNLLATGVVTIPQSGQKHCIGLGIV